MFQGLFPLESGKAVGVGVGRDTDGQQHCGFCDNAKGDVYSNAGALLPVCCIRCQTQPPVVVGMEWSYSEVCARLT